MVLFNYSTRELTAKIVYYGPGLCGKTTNLQYIFDNLPGSVKGKMLSLATKTDRTLFFDFLPLDLGEIRGMKTRIQLYTVPGQVFYNETRRLVLKGADGVVFVADSQKPMLEANVDSYKNLEENLRVHSMRLADMPLVMQYNKRDLPNVASIEDLNTATNRYNSPFYESVATTGIGVQDTLKAITKLVLLHLTKRYDAKQKAGLSTQEPQGGETAAPAQPRSTVQVAVPAAIGRPGPDGTSLEPTAAAAPTTALDDSAVGEEEVLELTDEVGEEASAASMEEEPLELVDEVEDMEQTVSISTRRAEAEEREFEIDHSVDEDESDSLRTEPAVAASAAQPHTAPSPAVRVEVGASPEAPPLVPKVGVARAVGQSPGEIEVPIEIEIAGQVRSFTISIRVRIDESATRR
jgi:signal recognition particle receptor subunit beta